MLNTLSFHIAGVSLVENPDYPSNPSFLSMCPSICLVIVPFMSPSGPYLKAMEGLGTSVPLKKFWRKQNLGVI